LDGDQIMTILDVRPGRVVGEARAFLMELRLDEGPLGEDEAEKRLRAWAVGRELS
jgi:poly(A) polymerase